MTSATIKSTFLTAHMKLVKRFEADGTVTAYPNASRMTSYEATYPLTQKGMLQRLADMRKFAKEGGCLLRGNLIEQIKDKSRAGLTNKTEELQTVMLDFDKIKMDTSSFLKTKTVKNLEVKEVNVTEKDILDIAEKLLAMTPLPKDVSYFVHASSSMGVRNDVVSMHIEFVLPKGVPSERQRLWIEQTALFCPELRRNLTLSRNGMCLCWPLDPSVAANSKIIYIADPVFAVEADNPVKGERIFYVEKEKLLLQDSYIVVKDGGVIANAKDMTIAELRAAAKLPKADLRTSSIRMDGNQVKIFQKVGKMYIEEAYENGDFVYCNVNGGDSHAYYFLKRDPAIMLNFKGEPAFKISEAHKEFYELMCKKYEDFAAKNDSGRAFLRRNLAEKGSLVGIILEDTGELASADPLNNDAAESWAFERETYMPEFIPTTRIEFDPTAEPGVRTEIKAGFKEELINSYKVPYSIRMKDDVDFVMDYDNCVELLAEHCPAHSTLLTHVCGDDVQMLRHFINWLATGAQRRIKNKTTFLFQGVQGTGKGIMFEHVIMPLFGSEYCKSLSIQNLEEKHSGYLDNLLFLLIDEFRHGDSQATKFLENKIKMFVTETMMPVRRMNMDSENIKTFFQMVFFSNNHDAIRIPEGDRRINVCPRQERKLQAIFRDAKSQTEQHERISTLLEDLQLEQPKFLGAMMSMKYYAARAEMVIENEAKKRMQHAARTKAEDFQAAITKGDIAYFLECVQSVTLPEQKASLTRGLRGIMQKYSFQMTSGNPTVLVPLGDLTPFFSMANDLKETAGGFHFRKWCARHTIDVVSDDQGVYIRMRFVRNDTLAQRALAATAAKAASNFGPREDSNEHSV